MINNIFHCFRKPQIKSSNIERIQEETRDKLIDYGKIKGIKSSNHNITVDNFQRMPENIASCINESQDMINNYAKSKNAFFRFGVSEADKRMGNADSIHIDMIQNSLSSGAIFKEDKTSKKPLLRQLYETIQFYAGDVSPIEKMKNDTTIKLVKTGKIKPETVIDMTKARKMNPVVQFTLNLLEKKK